MEKLRALEHSRVLKVSDYLETKPYGGVEQGDFLNACLELETLLYPTELLHAMQEIEREAHRERLQHWGPRTLDLDPGVLRRRGHRQRGAYRAAPGYAEPGLRARADGAGSRLS